MLLATLSFTEWVFVILCAAPALYATLVALIPHGYPAPRVNVDESPVKLQPVSVLKPLCGFEPRLYANLETFCEQTHPCYQLIFGVASPADPAVAIVERLRATYPDRDISLVVDASNYGVNCKVGNLINLESHAHYDLIVVADSDIAVRPDYLVKVTAPLRRPEVGVVTCLYRARRIGGIWTRMGALFIDEWFCPSVYLADAAGSQRFGFGATLAMRRETLDAIGGFFAFRDCIADDFSLAHAIRELGFRTHLSEVVVSTDVIERNFSSLWQRETRWLRTIRSVHPFGFAFLFFSFTYPWLILSFVLGLGLQWGPIQSPAADMMIDLCTSFGASARLLLHWRRARDWRAFIRELPLLPLRDFLLSAEWLAAAFGSHVIWRGRRIRVDNESGDRTPAPDASDLLDRS